MTERPILFSGPMVRAILAGKKTQTRRIANPARVRCPYGQAVGDRLWVRETWLIDRYDGSTQYAASHPCPSAPPRWKPSIHMPRARCRLVLEVQFVRLESLQKITSDDAIAEGIEPSDVGDAREEAAFNIAAYAELWDSLNKKRGYGWDTNPLVWVIDFKRLGGDNDA